MLRRSRISVLIAAAVVSVGLAAGVAQAQDYPPPTEPPPTGIPCDGSVAASGALTAGNNVVIGAVAACIVAGNVYDGVLQSTAVALPDVVAVGNTVSYPVTLPADWERNAFHTLTVTRADTGALVMTERFYVDGAGRITAPPKGSGLPRTGSSSDAMAKTAVVLLAVGAGAVAVARKRRTAKASAA